MPDVLHLVRESAGPNQALQRTRLRVTAPASTAAFPPTTQVPRRSGVSLSLGSFGQLTIRETMRSIAFSILACGITVVGVAEDRLMQGGKSPDGAYEIRIERLK